MNLLEILRDVIKGKPILFLVVFFMIGCLLGWWIMGYVIWPVQYVGESHSYELTTPEKEQYILIVADSYKLTGNAADAKASLAGWDNGEVTVLIANVSTNLYNQGLSDAAQRVEDLARALGTPPGVVPTVSPPEGEAPTLSQPSPPSKTSTFSIMSLIQICIGLIIIIIVIAAILFIVDLRRRKAKTTDARPDADKTLIEGAEIDETASGHFRSKYTLGDDNYDESFSIETAAGEFLGECGIGISETLESGPPDRVTAFEVWLFDKSDIRTVTKVLTSEFAFNETSLRDKLAPKGEALLTQEGQTFNIETDAFDMEVHVLEVNYGTEGQYPNSYFDSLTVELIPRPRESTA